MIPAHPDVPPQDGRCPIPPPAGRGYLSRASWRKIAITALMLWTLVVTVLRALRAPNDFAEMHWLLDYRFGFVKRGLIGEILSLVTGWMSIPITEGLISSLAAVAFVAYCSVISILSVRIVRRSGWSGAAVMVSLAFLSSPFVVMSAHLNGYLDNIVIVLGVASVVFLLRGRPWLASCLQVVAVFVHENSMLLIFPPFCLAWLLTNNRRQMSGTASLSPVPLFMPILAFMIVVAGQSLLVAPGFADSFAARLSRFPFIGEGLNTMGPAWVSASFMTCFASEGSKFLGRLTSPDMYGLVLPSLLAILGFTISVFRIRDLSLESFGLLGVCLVPLVAHLAAWDTARIWTYPILGAFLSLWIYSELFPGEHARSTNGLLCLLALVTNAVILTPLMDDQSDRFGLKTRCALYAPVIAGGLLLIVNDGRLTIRERLSVQGHSILRTRGATTRCQATADSANRSESEAPGR